MDTEGTNREKCDFKDDVRVYALSTVISSLQIFNIKDDLQMDSLEYLEVR